MANNTKQTPIPVVPRTMKIVNPDGTVTRSGQQLLEQLQPSSTLSGAHADRPVPGDVPEGAFYVESDRGVIYQNQGGNWQYIAGVMYGTIFPDQRPTDLGTYDAGFEYRAADSDPGNTGRDFIWDGTAWIETTPVLYGVHADRPLPADAPARCIYVETDRGPIYQSQLGVWTYLAGTMWGTLSPDERPTDLGVHDVGFTFRTNVAPAREFIWSQTAWVEVTPVTGAVNLTHANAVTKVGAAGQIVEGGITDLSAGNSGKISITAAGDVGIGVGSAQGRLDVKGAPLTAFRVGDASSPTTDYTIGRNNSDGFLTFNGVQGTFSGYHFQVNNGTELITVTNAGRVGIGAPVPGYQLQVSTDSAGKPASSTWAVISDLRLKQNIEPAKDDSLGILNKLDWIRYEYNGQASTPKGAKGIGLVAQVLREQMPEAVRSSKAKLNETDAEQIDLLAIDYHHIIVHSARAIQQLSAEVKRLAALIGKPA